jgi:hypothetical protein
MSAGLAPLFGLSRDPDTVNLSVARIRRIGGGFGG